MVFIQKHILTNLTLRDDSFYENHQSGETTPLMLVYYGRKNVFILKRVLQSVMLYLFVKKMFFWLYFCIGNMFFFKLVIDYIIHIM